MKIAVLVGGTGGARFLHGVVTAFPQADISAIVNTSNDVTVHGLRVCPDLDTAMYLLGGAVDFKHPNTHPDATQTVQAELSRYGAEASWYPLADREIATNLIRTQSLDAGYSLSEVTDALCDRWLASEGERVNVHLLPMTNARCETHVVVDTETGPRAVHVQQWRHKNGAQTAPRSLVQIGLDTAEPTPTVIDAITDADFVLISPGSPAFSIATILAMPRLHAALVATKATVVGIAPVIADAADGEHATPHGVMRSGLQALGVSATAEAIGRHYGGRGEGGVLDFWLISMDDSADIAGVVTVSGDVEMATPADAAVLARAAIDAASGQA